MTGRRNLQACVCKLLCLENKNYLVYNDSHKTSYVRVFRITLQLNVCCVVNVVRLFYFILSGRFRQRLLVETAHAPTCISVRGSSFILIPWQEQQGSMRNVVHPYVISPIPLLTIHHHHHVHGLGLWKACSGFEIYFY
jgi:hypothetical protein